MPLRKLLPYLWQRLIQRWPKRISWQIQSYQSEEQAVRMSAIGLQSEIDALNEKINKPQLISMHQLRAHRKYRAKLKAELKEQLAKEKNDPQLHLKLKWQPLPPPSMKRE
jgi:hypothetical protein